MADFTAPISFCFSIVVCDLQNTYHSLHHMSMGDQTSPFLVACPWLNTEKTTCPHFVFEDTLGFSIRMLVKLEISDVLSLYIIYIGYYTGSRYY